MRNRGEGKPGRRHLEDVRQVELGFATEVLTVRSMNMACLVLGLGNSGGDYTRGERSDS